VLNPARYSSDLDRDDQIDVQLVLGQPGWQFGLACGSFRVDAPFFGAAPHVETC
jgi:hypothetical protein